MALELVLWAESFKAEADLSTYQYHCMEMSAEGQVDVCDNAGDTVIGILQNKPAAAGDPAEVALFGISKAMAGGVIAVGDLLGTDADGHVVVKSANNDKVIGRARTAAAGAGVYVEVFLGIGVGYLGV